MRGFRRSSPSKARTYQGQHRFEHWYRDHAVYFITARCKDKYPAFASPEAQRIFWDRFRVYARQYGFTPWVTSLMINHYHTVGFLQVGENLGPFMRHLHGSVAKLVNDFLPRRLTPFWHDTGKQGYFDGCLRDEKQGRATYRYVLTQAVRHRVARDWKEYPNTVVNVKLSDAISFAHAHRGFMERVGYKRYARGEDACH
jgi:REP element-mobilizing transposase RayT